MASVLDLQGLDAPVLEDMAASATSNCCTGTATTYWDYCDEG